jgi:hypothetical protein
LIQIDLGNEIGIFGQDSESRFVEIMFLAASQDATEKKKQNSQLLAATLW